MSGLPGQRRLAESSNEEWPSDEARRGLSRSLVRSLRVAALAGGRHFWLLMGCQLLTAVVLLVHLAVARSLLDDLVAVAADSGGRLGPLLPEIGLLSGLLLASSLAAGFEVDQRRLLADLIGQDAPNPCAPHRCGGRTRSL